MSLNAYHRSLSAGQMNFKIFVRESTKTSRENVRVDTTRKLNFSGDEAKIAYEEIVNCKQSDRDISRNLRIVESRNSKFQERRRIEERCNVKVTVNSILKAVEHNDVEFLERNLNSENINVTDNYGWTPLMSAAFCGNLEIVETALRLGADVKRREKSGSTAAQLALKKNHFGVVERLMRKESSLATTSSSESESLDIIPGESPFYCSVCEETFAETTLEKHRASTLHVFNTKPKLINGTYVIPRSNKGYRMMLNKGWEESGGLGPDGEGSKYPVKTVLKRDRQGFGRDTKSNARVTHFCGGDARAVAEIVRKPRNATLRKRDREKLLSREARRERAIRRALS